MVIARGSLASFSYGRIDLHVINFAIVGMFGSAQVRRTTGVSTFMGCGGFRERGACAHWRLVGSRHRDARDRNREPAHLGTATVRQARMLSTNTHPQLPLAV